MSHVNAVDDIRLFEQEEAAMRFSRTRVALLLGAGLMPFGVALDWQLHPASVPMLLGIRLVTTLVLLVGLWALSRWRAIPIRSASLCLLLVPAAAIAAMILQTGGAGSLYFFGLILLMIFVQLLGFSAIEALIYCLVTTLMYLLAVWLPATHSAGSAEYVPLASFFLITTSLVCTVICHLNRRNRLNNFRLRKSLDEKNHQLKQLDEQRMDFLANVSHELRTPLAMVLAPLDELLSSRGNVSLATGASLALVRRNADRLKLLVDDLLDIVRVDHASFRLQLEAVDVSEFLREVLATIRHAALQHGLRIELECEPQPIFLKLDVPRMERVFLNLINNAIKFSPQGGRIRLRLRRTAADAVITVEDQGPGIPAEHRERVFDRMFQSHQGVHSAKGLGLGLAISQEIVQWHGGQISVQPCEPQGSCFVVRIPLVPQIDVEASSPPLAGTAATKADMLEWLTPEAADPAAADPAAADPAAVDSLAEAPQVLIIDDEPDLRIFLKSSLDSQFTTSAAATAEEGWQIARRWVPHCILLDFMLPDEDGLSVLRRMRQEPVLRDTKIIMLTAHFDENVKLEALRLGADDFLSKPFGLTEMRARVAGLVRSSRLQADLRSEQEALRLSLEQLSQTQAQLFQSEKMRAVASLAAGLLHEINNPIYFTSMAIKTLRRDLEKSRDVSETITDIQDGIQRIADIITDLRTFAYPEEAVLTTEFPIAEAVRTAFRFAAHDAHTVALQADFQRLSELVVHGSKSQLTQVVLNLILNSIAALRKAAQDDEQDRQHRPPPLVTVSASIQPASPATPSARLVLSVSDNGPGIPRELQKQICDPFFTTAGPGKNLGLGLSICDTIVRGHGGTLVINSNENGAHISFDIPLAYESHGHEDARPRETNPVCR